MPDHVVTDEKGQKHRFPDEATPEMIAEALGIQPPGAAPAPNLKTGEGMEAQSQQQAAQYLQGRATAPYEQQQAELQQRKNRAVKWQMNNPTPVTNASAVMAPMPAARAIAGGKVGAYAGDKVLPGGWGSLIGGLLGGTAASYNPGGITKAAQRITRGPTGAADVSVSPLTIASRELENVVPRQPLPWDTPTQGPAAPLPAADEFYANKGADLARRGVQQNALDRAASKVPPWQAPSHDVIKPGTPEFADAAYGKGNQYPWSRVPSRAPVSARSVDPFSGEPTAQAKPPADQPIETFPEPNPAVNADRPGSLWSVPREQLETRATRGQPGALDVLKNVRKEPFLVQPRPSIGTPNPEFNALRESNMPQGNPTPFGQPIQVQKDSMGIRWAHDGTNRVSIPQSVPDEGIEEYARPKLAEQATIRSQFPWMKGQ